MEISKGSISSNNRGLWTMFRRRCSQGLENCNCSVNCIANNMEILTAKTCP